MKRFRRVALFVTSLLLVAVAWEVYKLIWPAAGGAGVIDKAAWDRTAALSQETKNLEGSTVLTATPDADSYNNDIVNEALAILDGLGVDTKGSGYSPITVELQEGGA